MSKCPSCAESIPADAARCRHCGERVARPGDAPGALPVSKRGPGRGVVVALALLGALALGALVLVQVRWGNLGPRKDGNELVTAATMKSISTAQAMFQVADQDKDGRANFGTLAELGRAELVDAAVASGTRSGYVFDCRPAADPTQGWAAVAAPAAPGTTGDRYFGIDQEGVLLVSVTAPFSAQGGVLVSPPDALPFRR